MGWSSFHECPTFIKQGKIWHFSMITIDFCILHLHATAAKNFEWKTREFQNDGFPQVVCQNEWYQVLMAWDLIVCRGQREGKKPFPFSKISFFVKKRRKPKSVKFFHHCRKNNSRESTLFLGLVWMASEQASSVEIFNGLVWLQIYWLQVLAKCHYMCIFVSCDTQEFKNQKLRKLRS